MSPGKVLIVTYYWPPSGGVGVQRWLHFARNIKKMGWEPIIYTPENPQFEIRDAALEKMADGLVVIKKPIWEPLSVFHKLTRNKEKNNVQQGAVLEKSQTGWKDRMILWIRGNMFVPDPRVFWVRSSVAFLKEYVQREGIKVVITTGPPHSMHLIGLRLKRSQRSIKWIADFRDPWSDWDVLKKFSTGRLAMNKHRRYERHVIEEADVVTTVSNRLAQTLAAKTRNERRVEVLANGIADDKRENLSVGRGAEDKFVIGYYGMLNELRDPVHFWRVLTALCEENKFFAERLQIRISGIISQSIRDALAENVQLRDKVVFLGYIPHEKIFEEYRRCNVLLLLLNKSDNARWILPMKFFEYLSAGRSILSLGPEDSDLGDAFQGNKIGEIMAPEDEEKQREFILSNFEGRYVLMQEDYEKLLLRYSRNHQAYELTKLLEKV